MAQSPYAFSGTLSFPPDSGLPNVDITFSASGNFKSRPADILELTGTGSKSVNFGTVPIAGAKAILIEVDADSTGLKTPVLVKVNSSVTGKIEIAPGGFVAICNPVPVAGISALDIEHTSDNTVRIWILGG